MPDRVGRRLGLVIGQLTYGGAENQLYELALGLRDVHDVKVYCLSNASQPFGPRIEAGGVPVMVLEAKRNLDTSRILGLAEAFRADRIEIAHAFLYIASAYAYLATRIARGTRLVTSARNCKTEPSRLRRAVMRHAFKASRAVICNSHRMAEFAGEHYGTPRDRTHVVHNGVDAARFHTERGPRDGCIRIGTVGRLDVQKNYPLFLEAAAALCQRYPDIRFEIVGEGPEQARLEAEIARLGLGGTVVLGLPRRDIAGFLAGIDQFWLTSDWEGTPNVVLEAMAAGVPVVATAVGGTPELIEDGRSGFLVEPGSPDAFVSRAIRLLDDEELARAVGQRAQELAATRFSIPAMVGATSKVYDSLYA